VQNHSLAIVTLSVVFVSTLYLPSAQAQFITAPTGQIVETASNNFGPYYSGPLPTGTFTLADGLDISNQSVSATTNNTYGDMAASATMSASLSDSPNLDFNSAFSLSSSAVYASGSTLGASSEVYFNLTFTPSETLNLSVGLSGPFNSGFGNLNVNQIAFAINTNLVSLTTPGSTTLVLNSGLTYEITGTISTAIAQGDDFVDNSSSYNSPNGNFSFSVQTSAVPEPSISALLLTGLGLFLMARIVHRRAFARG
jgi:hypothetical protein